MNTDEVNVKENSHFQEGKLLSDDWWTPTEDSLPIEMEKKMIN